MTVYKDINSSVRIGGSLTLPAGSITLSNNITLDHTNGKVTATNFAGNGSLLTNLSSAAMADVLKLDGTRSMTGSLKVNGAGMSTEITSNDVLFNRPDATAYIVNKGANGGLTFRVSNTVNAMFLSSAGSATFYGNVSAAGYSITGTTINATGNLQENGTNLSAKYEPKGTLHDDRYYTETEMNTFLSGKSDVGHTHAFSELTSKPTTLAGYGITDASATGHTHTFASLTSKPTTLAGFGITDASLNTHLHDDRYLQLIGGALSNSLEINNTSDARLTLNADTDNDAAEGGEPKVVLTQDGGIIGAEIKLQQGGTTDNAMVIAPFVDYNTVTPVKNFNVYIHDKKIWHEGSFDPSTKADKTTSVIAGTGLSGGGDLSTSRTLTVKYGTTAGTAAEGNHLHDDRYYTETEMNTLLGGKSNTGHTHAFSELTSRPTTLSGFGITDAADKVHTHPISDVTNLQSELDGKSSTSHLHDDRYYTETEIDTKLATKSDTTHLHDDRYYTETESDSRFLPKFSTTGSIVPFYARGTGLNTSANRILRIGNTEIYNGTNGRGLTLTIINKSDLAIVSTTNYDTYGLTTASDSLATALNAVTRNQLGVLTSYDAWEQSVTANLDAAFKRLGLYKAAYHYNSGSRDPYAAIFQGSGDGTNTSPSAIAFEVMNTNSVGDPYSELVGWIINGAFVASHSKINALTNTTGDLESIAVDEGGKVWIKKDTDIVGNVTVSGTVDGVDISAFKSTYDSHNHDSRYYTETEMDTKLSTKSDTSHNHDSTYFKLSGGTVTGSTTMNASLTMANGVDIRLQAGSANVNDSGDLVFTDNTGAELARLYYGGSAENMYLRFGSTGTSRTIWTTGNFTPGNKADKTITISAGNGLTGGGDLSANRTLAISYGGNGSALTVSRSDHNHDGTYYTVAEADALLLNKSDTTHLHDDRYYTETEINTFLSGKSDTSHAHAWSEITAKPTTFPATAHTHAIADVTGLQTALDGKLGDTETAVAAAKWSTARTLTLNGDVSGSTTWDGSGNATIGVTVSDDSHEHTRLDSVDDRDVKPADTSKGFLKSYFTSLEGLTGVAGTDYQDLLVMNGYTDTSGGLVNALSFDKSSMVIKHYQAAQADTTWGTPKTLAYTDSSITGNAATATKLATARTISLSGDVSGSGTFDGSGNLAITTTVADDSHNHIIGNVDGLQSALDGKAASSHTHIWADITDKPTTFTATAHTHAISEIVDLTTTLAGKSNTDHLHDDRYYTETEIDTKLSTKSDSGHTHAFSELTLKPTTLSGYGITDAATSAHLHDDRYLQLTGGTVTGATTFSNVVTLTGQGASGGTGMVNDTSLVLSHASGGSSSIFFRSGINHPSDYGYIRFEDSHTGTGESNRLTIGVENDGTADGIMLKGWTTINSDSTSTSNVNIVEFQADSVYKGKITAAGHLDLTGNITLGGTVDGVDIAAFKSAYDTHATAYASHNHDDRYYTEAEMNTKLAEKSDTTHAHTWSEVTDKPTTFAPSAHTHGISEITNLQTTLNGKSDTSHTHAFSSLTSIPTTISGYGITDAAPKYIPSYGGLSGFTTTGFTPLPIMGDEIRFRKPKSIEYFDGIGWVEWTGANMDNLTDGRGNTQGGQIDYAHRNFRITYDMEAWQGATLIYVCGSYHTPSGTLRFESTKDNWVTTNVRLDDAPMLGSYWRYANVGSVSDDNQIRFTFNFTGATETSSNWWLTEIQYITPRPGEQGSGWETWFPYSWDINKNMVAGGEMKASTFRNSSGTEVSYSGHTHDDRYYTESEINTFLSGKSNTGHTHLWADITDKPATFPATTHTHDDRYYTESEMDTKLSTKSDTSHTHSNATSAAHGLMSSTDKAKFDTMGALKFGTMTGGGGYIHFNSGAANNDPAWMGLRQVDSNTTRLYLNVGDDITSGDADYVAITTTQGKSDGVDTAYAAVSERIKLTGSGWVDAAAGFKWNGVSLDSRYAPLTHTHAIADVTGLTDALAGKSDSGHSHAWTEITGKPTTFAPSTHSHDDLYYTETEIDTKITTINTAISGKSDSGHTHAYSTLTGIPTTFAPSAHTHAIVDVTGLSDALAGKSDSGHAHAWTEITSKPTTFPATAHTHLWADITDKPTTFAPATHSHAWTEITSKPTTFAPSAHTHLWADITDKPSTFAPSAHTHLWADITDKPTLDNYVSWKLSANTEATPVAITSGGTVDFKAGSNVTISRSNNTITISSTDTNTDTNNYLTGVSGSGNGTVTFTRQGLTSLTWDASHNHDAAYLGKTAKAADSELLDGKDSTSYVRGGWKEYSSVTGDDGTDGWYTLFSVSDSSNAPIQCHVRCYAHTSALFVVSQGYAGSQGNITVLNAVTSSTNAGYKYLKGIRLLSTGQVQIKLNGGANTLMDVQLISSGEVVSPVATLVKETGAPTVTDIVEPLVNHSIRTRGNIYTDGELYSGTNKVYHAGNLTPSSYLTTGANQSTGSGFTVGGTMYLGTTSAGSNNGDLIIRGGGNATIHLDGDSSGSINSTVKSYISGTGTATFAGTMTANKIVVSDTGLVVNLNAERLEGKRTWDFDAPISNKDSFGAGVITGMRPKQGGATGPDASVKIEPGIVYTSSGRRFEFTSDYTVTVPAAYQQYNRWDIYYVRGPKAANGNPDPVGEGTIEYAKGATDGVLPTLPEGSIPLVKIFVPMNDMGGVTVKDGSTGETPNLYDIRQWRTVRLESNNTFKVDGAIQAQNEITEAGELLKDKYARLGFNNTYVGSQDISGRVKITSTGTLGNNIDDAEYYLQITDGSAKLVVDPNEILASNDLAVRAKSGSLTLEGNTIVMASKIEASNNATTVTISAGQTEATWTHNYGSTSYAVNLTPDSFERHVRWKKGSKLNNTIVIEIDTPSAEDILVDCILIGY